MVIANGKGRERELIRGDFAAHIVNIHGDLHADGNLTQNSDGRLKTDIQPVEQALASILLLEGRTYRWNEDTLLANRRDIGLIAQDVEKVFPELVAEDRQGYKGI
ncbi:MAG: tail fiber domain-containing protein, partial [Pseudomonadota bacterium]|nr:tail fiber domain-containing protein [Pseudomonadota bacterium]